MVHNSNCSGGKERGTRGTPVMLVMSSSHVHLRPLGSLLELRPGIKTKRGTQVTELTARHAGPCRQIVLPSAKKQRLQMVRLDFVHVYSDQSFSFEKNNHVPYSLARLVNKANHCSFVIEFSENVAIDSRGC